MGTDISVGIGGSGRRAARVAVLALLWGSTFLWIRLALDGLAPVQVTFIRCALGAAVLVAGCRRKGLRLPRDRAVWGRLVIAAFFCNALPFALFSLAERSVGSGVAGALGATTPLWSVLIGIVIGTEHGLRLARSAGLVLGFAGTLLIYAPWQRGQLASWGALAVLAAAAGYAVAFVFMRRTLVGTGLPTLSLSAAQLLAATGWSALTLPAGGLEWPRGGPGALISVVVLGVFATGITFHLTFRIIADEGATDAATVGYLLPVVSLTLGAIVLDERLGLRIATGMSVVLVGVALTRRRRAVQPTNE